MSLLEKTVLLMAMGLALVIAAAVARADESTVWELAVYRAGAAADAPVEDGNTNFGDIVSAQKRPCSWGSKELEYCLIVPVRGVKDRANLQFEAVAEGVEGRQRQWRIKLTKLKNDVDPKLDLDRVASLDPTYQPFLDQGIVIDVRNANGLFKNKDTKVDGDVPSNEGNE